MSKRGNQKGKLLILLQILREKSDENHPLSMPDILRALEEHGISAERKSIYDDFLTLEELGYRVERVTGRPGGYYLDTHLFLLPELKLLVDAVQAAKFITKEKSRELIRKLESTVSTPTAAALSRQVYVADRVKTQNTAVFSAVDMIHAAIHENRQIRFRYYERNEKKEYVFRRSGEYYEVSPFALAWSDENYYLIAYDNKDQAVRHYRVDRMKNTCLTERKREGEESFLHFDLSLYTRSLFGMFNGRSELVTLRCQNRLASVILDRFGEEVTMIPEGNTCFRVTVPVVVSPHFFGFVASFGHQMQIVAPQPVVKEIQEFLQDAISGYPEKEKRE